MRGGRSSRGWRGRGRRSTSCSAPVRSQRPFSSSSLSLSLATPFMSSSRLRFCFCTSSNLLTVKCALLFCAAVLESPRVSISGSSPSPRHGSTAKARASPAAIRRPPGRRAAAVGGRRSEWSSDSDVRHTSLLRNTNSQHACTTSILQVLTELLLCAQDDDARSSPAKLEHGLRVAAGYRDQSLSRRIEAAAASGWVESSPSTDGDADGGERRGAAAQGRTARSYV